MKDLRLMPAALVCWLTLVALEGMQQPVLAMLVLGVSTLAAWTWGQRGHAVLIGGLGLACLIRGFSPALGVDLGVFDTQWAAHMRARLGEAMGAVGPHSRGLIMGMVLGDTSFQQSAEREAYVRTGLSHLSAVSGANISIITTAMCIATRLAGLSPRLQIAGAAVVMVAYIVIVGPEPSVLRAGVTGAVGLAAVLNSSRMPPSHALGLAIIILLLCSPQLASSFGFALSVAATAGIIGLYPFIYVLLAPLRLPDILSRAVAVAMAADVMTMPLVALMTGRISLVSVVANVAVAPLAAPITILGLVALLLAQVGAAAPVLWLIEPMTWWIYQVAHTLQGLPLATVRATPLAVLVALGWIAWFGCARYYETHVNQPSAPHHRGQ